jgi:hypothetical protein
MAPERRANRANTRATRTLLPPELPASAAHFALVFRLGGTAAQSAKIPAGSFVQQVFVYFDTKDRVGQIYLTNCLAIQIDYIYDRHNFVSFS